MSPPETRLSYNIQAVVEILLRLARESHYYVCRNTEQRIIVADRSDYVEVFFAAVMPVHRSEHAAAAALDRKVKMMAESSVPDDLLDIVLVNDCRLKRAQSDSEIFPFRAFHIIDRCQQFGKAAVRSVLRTVKRSIDARQRTIYVNLTVRIFINENNVLRIEYHVYDSHACPKSNYVADLGLGYISPYDILLAVENENVVINGNRAGHYVANRDLITTKITDLKVVNGQLHWEWKSIFR